MTTVLTLDNEGMRLRLAYGPDQPVQPLALMTSESADAPSEARTFSEPATVAELYAEPQTACRDESSGLPFGIRVEEVVMP